MLACAHNACLMSRASPIDQDTRAPCSDAEPYRQPAAAMSTDHMQAVWFLTVHTDSGAEVFSQRLAEALRKRGIRAEITWLPLRAEYAPWTVAVPQPPPWATLTHVNTWLHSRFLPKHLPIVATIHHSVHLPGLRRFKSFTRAAYHRWWIAPNERRVLRRATRVVAVSRFVAAAASQFLLDVPMEVIYNGVDTGMFRPGTQRPSHKRFRLLYVGKWVPLKGVDLLVPIMRQLGEAFELYYTGADAPERVTRDMPSNMRNIGKLQNAEAVVAAMQDADALLFPSRSEGFGLVVAEAMACGLPVIAAQASSMPEIVADGVTGMLCRQDDVVMFANAARTLAQDGAFLGKASQQARALALQKFSIAAMCAAYEKVYATCIYNNPLVARSA